MKYINKKPRKVFWYYKFLCVFIIVFFLFFLFSNTISDHVYNSKLKSYVIDICTKPISYLKIYNVFNYKNLFLENKSLNKKVIDLELKSDMKYNDDDLANLKELTKEDFYSDYKKVYSKVLYRNKMYWYNTITIDKGSKDGIKNNSLVVDKNGLIGVIQSTSLKNSVVRLITSNKNDDKISVGLKTEKGFKYGTLEAYEYPYLKIELTTNESYIKTNDIVLTSGLGNLPKGIKIGEVKKIERDSYDLTSILYVLPLGNIEDINYLAVLVK